MSREQERKVIEEVTLFLQEKGYTISYAHDSEERMEKADLDEALSSKDLNPVLNWVMAADGGSIGFKTPDGGRFAIHMMYGNSPEEVIYNTSGNNEEELLKGDALVNARLEDLIEEMSTAPTL